MSKLGGVEISSFYFESFKRDIFDVEMVSEGYNGANKPINM